MGCHGQLAMVDPADVETVVSVDHDGETVTVPAQFDSSDDTVNTGLPGEWRIDRVYTNGEGQLVAEKYIPGGQFIRAVSLGPSSENVWEAYYWEPQTRTSARTFRPGDDETDHWVRNGSAYADHRQHESIGRVISDTTAARGVDWYVCRVVGHPQIEWAEATGRNRATVSKNIRRAREDIFGDDDSDVDVEQYVQRNSLWTEPEIIDDLAEVISGTTVAGGIDEYAKLMDVPDVDWAETTDRNRHTIKNNRERAFDDRFE